jgi:hypothetical protein
MSLCNVGPPCDWVTDKNNEPFFTFNEISHNNMIQVEGSIIIVNPDPIHPSCTWQLLHLWDNNHDETRHDCTCTPLISNNNKEKYYIL